MTERYIEKHYEEVLSLLSKAASFDRSLSKSLTDSLNSVHDIPEIGEALFAEEKKDLEKLYRSLQAKRDLNSDEQRLLTKVSQKLEEIDCQLEYLAGKDRIVADSTIVHNLEHLKALSTDAGYQRCVAHAANKLHELFKNRLGTRTGTVIFHDTMNHLASLYSFAKINNEFNESDLKTLRYLLLDIAKNINNGACTYLRSKDQDFFGFF